MSINFSKIIIKSIKSNISKNIKLNENTKFDDIKEFDSLNFVKLVIFLNKYSIQLNSEELSRIKKIKDLINACKKNKK